MPNFYSTLRRFALTTLLSGGGLLAAQAQIGQTVTGATNVAGTYTDLGTTGTVITTTSTDNANSAAQDIGFTFGFNGATFTQFVLNTNGIMRLGSVAPSTAALYYDNSTATTAVDPLQSTNAADVNLLMPFNADLVSGTGGAEYRVATTGTTGARVCTIQWKNVADKAGTGTTNAQQFTNFSFQVKLYEATGAVEFVYGTAAASATAAVRFSDVGLKGSGIGVTGQLLLATKASTAAWSAATFRSSNYGLNTFDYANTPLPDAGRTYRFTDPAYCVAGAYTGFPAAYTQNFDGVTAPILPCGVTVIDANSDGTTWVNTASNPSSSPNAMRYMYSLTNPANDWFFTNGLTMTVGKSYQLQFKYRAYLATYPEGLEVKVGSTATVAGQTTAVFSNTNIMNTTYTTTTPGSAAGQAVLFTPTTSGVYYFGFHAISTTNQYYLYVDDIQVSEQVAPACPQPTAVVVGGITSSGATVTFAGPANSTGYTVIYVPKGSPVTSTSPSVPTTTLSATLANLAQNTSYDVYVQATCGTSGSSVTTGPISFQTRCATTTTFPYTENFDGVTAPTLPCGITVLDANNDGKSWTNLNSTTYSASGTNSMRYSYASAAADDWFFTNGLQLTAGATYQLQFKYRSYSATYPEGLEVKVGAGTTAADQTTKLFSNTSIATATYITTAPGTGTGQVASFTPTTSGLYYFGFHAISAANQFYLQVDDVQVTLTSLASCPTPTNVTVNGVTDTQAQVTFNGPSVGTSYKVTYVLKGAPVTSTSPSATGNASPITIAGLSANTAYDVYIQGTCGAAGLGIQGGPVSFTTACATTTSFPYTQNFDGATAPALPCGITVFDINNDGSTWVNSTDQPSSGANSMRYIPSTVNGADDWFFLNAMSMQQGMRYQLSFKYRVFSYNYPERMEVKIGNSTTAASQTTTLFSNNNMLNNVYVATAAGNGAGQVAGFSPTTSGIYFIGFHATSTVNSFSIYVDDVSVSATTVTSTKSNVAPGFSAEASPVPFNDHLTLTLNTLQAGPLQLTLHDAVGRVVRETTANVPAGASSLAVPNAGTLPAGMYLLTVRQGGNTQVIRVAHE